MRIFEKDGKFYMLFHEHEDVFKGVVLKYVTFGEVEWNEEWQSYFTTKNSYLLSAKKFFEQYKEVSDEIY